MKRPIGAERGLQVRLVVATKHGFGAESKHTGKDKGARLSSTIRRVSAVGHRRRRSNHFAPSAEVPERMLALFIVLPMIPLDSVATRLRNAA
jgi:hypothetical protein